MGGGGSAPQAPDPKVTIPLQQKADMENFYKQLDAMRSNSTNPYGGSTWTSQENFDQQGYDTALADYNTRLGEWEKAPAYTPTYDWEGSPTSQMQPGRGDRPEAPNRASFMQGKTYENNVGFNPEMQGQFDQVQNLQKSLFSSMNPNESVDLIDDAGGQYSQDLADAIYRRTTRMSDQNFGEAQRGLEQRLAERGFQVGNEGFNTEMGRLGTQRSEHYSDAADRAQITAAQQGLQEAGFTNQSRLSEMQANSNLRSQLAQLLSGRESQLMGGLSGNPTQFQAPQMPGIDVLGAYNNKYMGELDAYNADQASSAGMFSSLLGLGANFLLPGAGSALGLGAGASAGLGALGGSMLGGGLSAPRTGFWG